MPNRPSSNGSRERVKTITEVLGVDRRWSALVIENLPHIERQCRKAVSRYGHHLQDNDPGAQQYGDICIDNAVDELFNELLDRLCAENFRVLRSFSGSTKITSYLTAIISNLVVDIIRSKKGRSWAKERAREFGFVGEVLHDLVYGRGYHLHEAHEHLKTEYQIEESLDTLQTMAVRIAGRDFAVDSEVCGAAVALQADGGGEIEHVLVDDRNPERAFAARQRQRAAEEALSEIMESMTGEELVMVRMRFPAEEDMPGAKAAEIARALNLTERVVDSRLRRVFKRCREMLLRRGVRLDDLV